ncbi:dynamin family protein, partial [Nonomuraea sp. NPDC004297]
MNTAMDDGRQESLGEQTLSFRPVTDEDLDPEARTDDTPAAGPPTGAAPAGGLPDGGAPDGAASGRGALEHEPRDGATGPGLGPDEPRAARDPRTDREPHDAPDLREAGEPGQAQGRGEGREGPDARADEVVRGPGAQEAREEPPARRPSLFEKPAALRRPPPDDGPRPGDGRRPGDGARPDEGPSSLFRPVSVFEKPPAPERPSLFVRPAALDGPGARPAPGQAPDGLQDSAIQDDAARQVWAEATAESTERPDEPASTETVAPDGERPDEAADVHQPGDPADEPARDGGEPEPDSPAEAGDEAGTAAPESGNAPGTCDDAAPVAEPVAETDSEPDAEEQPSRPGERLEELPPEAMEALTTALNALRASIADMRFGLDLPGSDEARQARAELLAQLENYVLPRVRTRTAPALIVIAGSTGAGKSTLVNSLAEKNVSRTGVRRPTTGTPVLACHPDDRGWFADGELLGGLQRLDQASPETGMRGLVIAATEKLPQGVALLDTPDIDSVVEEHHEIAHRMLDAADLWIFVTTAARYADAPAWSLLRLAKERGARLAIVLSRVPQRSADVVLRHFVRMLTEYGLGDIDRFVIHESQVGDGKLPDSEVTDLRMWLAELSVDEERRAQAVRETLNGVLDSFRTRVPALAKHLEAQVAFRTELRGDVEGAFLRALSEIDKASKNGSLLHGEVLARWQDFAGSGDLVRSLQLRKRGRAAKQAPERVLAFKAAIRTGLESVIVAAANRACADAAARWRRRSELGAKLGEDLDRPSDELIRLTGRAIASWQEHL